MRKILEACPTCGGPLTVTEVKCDRCGTEVRARYQPCPFCSLSPDQMNFALMFIRSRGNLTEVEKSLGVSYPTLRAKLDEIIQAISPRPRAQPIEPAEPDRRRDVLSRLASGQMSAAEALAALRKGERD